ncbi:hypothetical protein QYE76_043735 [Lolium multiflorum]|uniref:Integrase catalytic domain-containing protein n=1 Tax=Lolium multiflorum TaxID=4521 RepID=A0AAD8TJB3_LOLMU|nr:hypothetical protein QYE76_043735 [Lolium multiflorum]
MENYSSSWEPAVMKMAVEMAAVSMEKPWGTSPLGGCGTETLSPGSWLRDDGGSELFSYRGFLRIIISITEAYRYEETISHLLVMIDKFTKWIEAKPIKKLDGSTAVTFLKEIIARYGYPHRIITDNGSKAFSSARDGDPNGPVIRSTPGDQRPSGEGKWLDPRHPAPGGAASAQAARLKSCPSCCGAAHNTKPLAASHPSSSYTGPKPSCRPTSSTTRQGSSYTQRPKEAREDGVDLVEEVRLMAESRSAVYQQSLRRYHSRKVKSLAFREGDLVLRLIQRTAGQHKLASPWEGPFIVSKAVGNDSYYLIDAQEAKKNKASKTEETKRPWNVSRLPTSYDRNPVSGGSKA